MKGKLTAEAVPAYDNLMQGYHAHVYRTGKGGKGKETVYRSPHAFTDKADAENDARNWIETNSEENE